MKLLRIIFFFSVFLNFAYAQKLSQIYSIDGDETPVNFQEVSEVALPMESIEEILYSPEIDSFTPITPARANELFAILRNDTRARMRSPGGYCQSRRIYIQSYLKNRAINSGRIYIQCPGNNGRLRLQDQVSGRYYTFSNFHDANVVRTTSGGYLVMDLQFQPSPVSLESYLAQIEVSQPLRPAGSLDEMAGTCYWSIQ